MNERNARKLGTKITSTAETRRRKKEVQAANAANQHKDINGIQNWLMD
jgi:hypothetical protein